MKLQRSALDHILSQLDKPDATHCWSREDIDAAREELRDLRHEAYMSRCRGDVLAEINDQLRSEVDTRTMTIDRLAAENARLRDALLSFTEAGCPCSDCTRARTALGGRDE